MCKSFATVPFIRTADFGCGLRPLTLKFNLSNGVVLYSLPSSEASALEKQLKDLQTQQNLILRNSKGSNRNAEQHAALDEEIAFLRDRYDFFWRCTYFKKASSATNK